MFSVLDSSKNKTNVNIQCLVLRILQYFKTKIMIEKKCFYFSDLSF